MDQMQRGVSCIVIALLAAHLANAGAYRAEGSGGISYDEFFGRTLGEEEEPLLKATSPKISITATTNGGTKNADANGLSGFGGAAGGADGNNAAADATLLSTIVTEFLASTAQTPNKEEGTEAVAAGPAEPSSASMEQSAGAATTTIMPSPSTAATATAAAASFYPPPAGDDTNRRRVITYDQRQEGQYNVRADLENFMIVLIPPTSVSDSLLDLLRKQQQRQSTLTALKRNKLKHHHGAYEHDGSSGSGISSSGSASSSKYPHSSIKIGQSAAAAAATVAATNYLTQQQLPQPLRPHYGGAASGYPLMPPLHAMQATYAEAAGNAATSGETATDKLGSPAEFIEGRTPYRVDISASDDEQSHLHLPERHEQLLHHTHGPSVAGEQSQHVVDVLPPPYTPLAYQHLMKPYLEVDPTFPPSELKRGGGGGSSGSHHLTPASGNFLETYTQLLNAGLGGGLGGGGEFNLKAANMHRGNSLANSGSSARHGGYFRNARSILGYDFFKGNQLDGSKSGSANANRYFYPLYRSEHSLGAAQLYPPLDLPRAAADDAVAGNSAEEQHLNPINVDADDQEQEDGEEGVERQQFPHIDDLPLTGYDYDEAMEMQAKKLLERCSPGQRRDSYGLCRKIEGY